MDRPTELEDKPSSTQAELLSKSARGATFLIILQISSRALTFVVNQILLRYLSPELLGISTQLEVYSISVIFFARESLRVALQRQVDHGDEKLRLNTSTQRNAARTAAAKSQEIVNLAYISVFLGALLAPLLGWLYWRSIGANSYLLQAPCFKESLLLYGVAACLELLAEPCFAVVQQKSEYKIRASVESIATVSRCVVTCTSAIVASQKGVDIGVLPFAAGQIMYSLVLWSVYVWKVWPVAGANGFSLFVSPIRSDDHNKYLFSYFSHTMLALGASLFVQSIVKHVLTQGDVIVISYLATLHAQGIYALVSNYGGLIARLLLQPIEESSRNYFSKALSTLDKRPSAAAIESTHDNIHNLLRFYVLLSTVAVAVGPYTAPVLLRIVAGSRWANTGAADVLSKYCYYIPLLAINGITEAFVSSVATQSELNAQSAWMMAFSLAFAAASYLFLRVLDWGAEGLVWANGINMSMRIIWSVTFIHAFFRRHGKTFGLDEVLPRGSTITLAVGVIAVFNRVQLATGNELADTAKCALVAGTFLILV